MMGILSESRWFFVAIVALLMATISSNGQLWDPIEIFNSILFGSEWRFSRVCQNNYSDEYLVASDHQIDALYDGRFLQAINGSSEWSSALDRLNIANQIGLQSRRKLGVTCSAEAWGFADRNEERLSNEPFRNDLECRHQIGELHSFVERLTAESRSCQPGVECPPKGGDTPIFDLKLWEQLNSFGRVPSGLPYQHNLLLGDFDSCARLGSTRYCLGAHGRIVAAHKFSNERNSHLIGMCLPQSCSSEYLRGSRDLMEKVDALVASNMPTIHSHRTKASDYSNQLNDIFCPPSPKSTYMKPLNDKLSKAMIVLAALWLGALIYATFVRNLFRSQATTWRDPIIGRNPETVHELVLRSFDLRANLSEFLNSSHSDERLIGVNAIKVLAMMWLMGTHLSMLIYPYVSNLNELPSYFMSTLHGPILLQGQHCVAIFFIVSGLLFGLKYLESPRVSIKHLIIWRYFRLMPMYFVAYAYIRKFAHLLGDGPLWDSGVSRQSEVRQCLLESWFVPLSMLSNLKSPFSHCLITGWHISNDFQIYLVLPLLLLARRHFQRVGFTLLVSVAFIITHLSHMWFWGRAENYDLRQIMKDPVRFGPHYILTRLALDYVNPLGRLGTYFIGVQVADLLLERHREHKQQQREQQQQQQQQLRQYRQQLSQQGRKRVAIEEETSAIENGGQQAEERALVGERCGRRAAGRETSRPASVGSLIDNLSLPLARPDRQAAPALCSALGGQSRRQAVSKDNASSDESREPETIAMAERRRRPSPPPSPSSSSPSPSLLSQVISGTPDQNSTWLTNFKDMCLIALGVSFLVIGLFSVLIPADGPLTDLVEPGLAKTVGYPTIRLFVELGWSIVLYYFLLTNLPPGHLDSKESPLKTANTSAEGRKEPLLSDKLKPSAGNKLAPGDERALRECQSHHHYESIIVGALKWRVWNVLVKANYAVMLTHYALFRLVVQSRRELFLFTWFNFTQLATSLIVLGYLLGALIYVAVEKPLTGLVRHLVTNLLIP